MRALVVPIAFCIPPMRTTKALIDLVAEELKKRFGQECDPGEEFERWRLFRCTDKWSVTQVGTPLEPNCEGDESSWDCGRDNRVYLAVEWAQDAELPPKLTQALRDIEEANAGTRGYSAEAELPLEKCFEMFTEREKLSEENEWY